MKWVPKQRANTPEVTIKNGNGEMGKKIYVLSLLYSVYKCEYRISSAYIGWMWDLRCVVEGKPGFLC